MPKTSKNYRSDRSGLIRELRNWETVITKLPQLTYAGDPILRCPCSKIEKSEFVNGEVGKWKNFMSETLLTYRKITGVGRGLAANQVSLSKRLVIIYLEDGIKLYANPEVTAESETQALYGEMCVSFGFIMGNIVRPYEITISYQTETGDPVTEVMNGIRARIMQHEMAHLRGRLCLDEAIPSSLRVPKFLKNEVFGEKLKIILPLS